MPTKSTATPDMTSQAVSVGIYPGSKCAVNAASVGCQSNFSGTAFCLAQPIGGLLVGILR